MHATAPTRICDLGGWTDTWFAAHGVVCHLPVWPGVEARLTPGDGTPGVLVHARAVDRTWRWRRGMTPAECPDPLIAASLDDASPPDDVSVTLEITSAIPAGASMGTSAATCVAVLSVFDALAGTSRPGADQARRAHVVETERLGWQSGVQDQWAAALGWPQRLTVGPYPQVSSERLQLTPESVAALNARLLVVWQGRSHASTTVHDQVIGALRAAGPDDPRLTRLRQIARDGADALEAGDLRDYGRLLTSNTGMQEALHPGLVNESAAAIADCARREGAWGWKVNGAGGDGGTVSILCATAFQRDALAGRIARAVPESRVLPIRLAGCV